MRRITLNDGTIYENSDIGFTNGVICCFINGETATVLNTFPVFSDSAKTEKIVYEFGEKQNTYEGFTHLGGIWEEYGGGITILLKRN